MTWVCSNCGQEFRTFPTVQYKNGQGGIITGPGSCLGSGSGRDSLQEKKDVPTA